MKLLNAGTAIGAGLSLSDLSLSDLWLRYVGIGGNHTCEELHAYIGGEAIWSELEHNIAAQALNDYFLDHGLDHLVAYAEEV
jgi:hypothetical protein